MTISRNAVIAIVAVVIAACGFYYYQNRQNVVEIKLPSIKIEKQ
jgi:hypothetical protein